MGSAFFFSYLTCYNIRIGYRTVHRSEHFQMCMKRSDIGDFRRESEDYDGTCPL